MNFLNPYEVLELDTPDTSEVRKARRKKLTEFDLSDDGSIEFKNLKIHRADFLRATDDLDNEQKSQFYWSIKNNPELSNFLSSGDTWFFVNYETQRIFNNPDFIEFISPYFAYQYNKVIFQTFNEGNASLLRKLVANPILVSPAQTDKTYQSLREFLNTQIQDLNQIKIDIENEESHYEEDNAEEVYTDLQDLININIYNTLPSYFQSQRNDIAQKLRNISVAVFNDLNSSEVSLQIIKYTLQLSINNLTKQNLEKDYNQIAEIDKERAEAEKYSPLLLKYALAIRQLQELIQGTEKSNNTNLLISKVNNIINIDELNNQPNVFDEIRNKVALSIRALSVEVFNENNDIETAISLIKIAQKVNVTDNETKRIIREAAKDLQEIAQKRVGEEKIVLIQISSIFSNMYTQIQYTHISQINQDKILKVFTDFFTKDTVELVANATNYLELQREIYQHCANIARKLEKKYSLAIIDCIQDIGKKNQDLANWISAFRAVQQKRDIKSPSSTSVNQTSNNSTSVSTTKNNNSWTLWLVGIGFCISGMWLTGMWAIGIPILLYCIHNWIRPLETSSTSVNQTSNDDIASWIGNNYSWIGRLLIIGILALIIIYKFFT